MMVVVVVIRLYHQISQALGNAKLVQHYYENSSEQILHSTSKLTIAIMDIVIIQYLYLKYESVISNHFAHTRFYMKSFLVDKLYLKNVSSHFGVTKEHH